MYHYSLVAIYQQIHLSVFICEPAGRLSVCLYYKPTKLVSMLYDSFRIRRGVSTSSVTSRPEEEGSTRSNLGLSGRDEEESRAELDLVLPGSPRQGFLYVNCV